MNDPETQISYPTYDDVVAFHVGLMQRLHEGYYGVSSESLLQSAIERPRMAAQFEDADLIRQAVHLLWGLVQNHPFVQGNKRTGVALAFALLLRNGLNVVAEQEDVVALGLAVAAGQMDVGVVDAWLRERTERLEQQ